MDNNSAGAMNSDYFLEINCKTCTYLNVGRDKCEMCETDLFKWSKDTYVNNLQYYPKDD